MDPQQLIDNAVEALEALKQIPGMDPGVIDECVHAVQAHASGEQREEGPPNPAYPEGEHHEEEGGATPPPTHRPSSFADATRAVMEHHRQTGSLPTTGRRGKFPVKR